MQVNPDVPGGQIIRFIRIFRAIRLFRWFPFSSTTTTQD